MSHKEEERQKYWKNIDRVDTWATTAAENGLFKVQTEVPLDTILEKLKEARDSLEEGPNSPHFSCCSDALSKAAGYYFKAINSTSLLWRFVNVYAVHLWVYLIVFLSIIFIFYYFHIDLSLKDTFSNEGGFSHLAIDAVAWGVIGSLLRGIWWLWKNVNDRKYRKAWIIWFISTPFLGGILGAIVYFLIFAGLLVITQNKGGDNINPIVVIVSAAYAGFNWNWAVERFGRSVPS